MSIFGKLENEGKLYWDTQNQLCNYIYKLSFEAFDKNDGIRGAVSTPEQHYARRRYAA